MTVLAFVGSMMWMNVAADELVGLLVAVGHVLELPAALLGATVLAWGNSLADAVSNTTMARDGYPTMAITACFASPLFILLAGKRGAPFRGGVSRLGSRRDVALGATAGPERKSFPAHA